MGAAQQIVLTMSLWCLHAGKLFGWLRSERLLLPWPGWWIQWHQALVNHWLSHLLCCWLGRCRPLVEGSSKPWEGNPVSSDHHFICNLQEWKCVLARADFNMLMKSWNVAAPSCNAFLYLFFLLLNVSDNHIFVCTLKLVSWELLVFPLSSTGLWSWTWRTWSVWILTGHLHWAGDAQQQLTDCHHCVWYYGDKPGHFRWKDKTPGRPELSRCWKTNL